MLNEKLKKKHLELAYGATCMIVFLAALALEKYMVTHIVAFIVIAEQFQRGVRSVFRGKPDLDS